MEHEPGTLVNNLGETRGEKGEKSKGKGRRQDAEDRQDAEKKEWFRLWFAVYYSIVSRKRIIGNPASQH